jgi:hypothetical protein
VASFGSSGADAPEPMREPYTFLETEADRVEGWRLGELIRAGYPVRTAEHLAKDFAVDLHQAVELVEAGCHPELAEAILS